MTIDLNADLGEGFPLDRELLGLVSSANVCLGAHAGSLELTLATVEYAQSLGVRVGLHPGYPDRARMGRTSPSDTELDDWLRSIHDQLAFGLRLAPAYVKPHGAYYHDLLNPDHADWPRLAAYLCDHQLPLMGLPGTAHQANAPAGFIREGFADRGYTDDGRLISRDQPGALLNKPSEVLSQAVRLAGTVDSICVHGDSPGALDLTRDLREGLERAGYAIQT